MYYKNSNEFEWIGKIKRGCYTKKVVIPKRVYYKRLSILIFKIDGRCSNHLTLEHQARLPLTKHLVIII